MSEVMPPADGVAARLIARAEGRLTALRPHIPLVFAAEQERGMPGFAVDEGPISAPPAPTAMPAAAPAAMHESIDVQAPQSSPSRLMPQSQSAEPLRPPGQQLAPAETPLSASVQASASTELVAAEHEVAASRQSPRQSLAAGTTTLLPRRNDSLSAAVIQLLGRSNSPAAPGSPDVQTFPREQQRQSERRASAANPASFASQPMRDPPSAAQSEPSLTIHIGEIIVAADTPAARPASPPVAAWQPPLSLADYRARRAEERR